MSETEVDQPEAERQPWLEAAARLEFLARLHDREFDAAFLDGLRGAQMPAWLAERFPVPEVRAATTALEAALAELPDPLDAATLDALAADYAEIYLTFGYRISASGSVWLTEDNLERQEPMFAIRRWYRRYGAEAPDWRSRPDDHLVHQLQFLAFLLRRGEAEADADAARFLDASLLHWLRKFAQRMAERVPSPLYVAIAAETATILEALRDELATATGVARPVPEDAKTKRRPTPLPDLDRPFMPGLTESW